MPGEQRRVAAVAGRARSGRSPSISASSGTPPGRSRRGAPPVQVEHGQFEADPARPAVEDGGDAAVELGGDMSGRGRADAAGAVGAGRGDRHAARRG